MAYKNVKTHSWTKDEIKKLAKVWESKTMDELAEEFGVERTQLSYIVGEVRKEYPKLLTKKHSIGKLRALIIEALG
jgi:hypothetical protein